MAPGIQRWLANHLQMNARNVYLKLQSAEIISNYIVPRYELLHLFSKDYIIEDLVEYMKKGVLEW